MNASLFMIIMPITLILVTIANIFYEFHLARSNAKKTRNINPLLDKNWTAQKEASIRKRLKRNGYDPKAFYQWLAYIECPHQYQLHNFNRHLDKRKPSLYHRPAKRRNFGQKHQLTLLASLIQTFKMLWNHLNRPIRFSQPFRHLQDKL